ncbi:ABC transporter C family member 13 [Nymphaea thermarum]|nr:ABC transporter C family member 13 [Nymphaea thermarum]
MVSVERILQYMDVIEEAQDGMVMDADWPRDGHIEFHKVTLKYMPSLPPALQNVSFSVPAGNQVGIVGRTGAGKSSVLNALFRLHPICEGCILLDGVDLASLAVGKLRSHLAVVPQSPFLFEGTLRDNLDPSKVANDSDIWNALEKCYIKEDIEAAGGLHIQIKEAGASFSLGQRQLICLARALLKSSKVLCLDECTANMDFQTASRLQNTISNECKGITILTIAHRISTILNVDKVLIFDQGILVEQGNPQFLLQDEFSRFSSFAKAGTL